LATPPAKRAKLEAAQAGIPEADIPPPPPPKEAPGVITGYFQNTLRTPELSELSELSELFVLVLGMYKLENSKMQIYKPSLKS
jgi:hypothetical protein